MSEPLPNPSVSILRLEELFCHAIELDRPERQAYLDRACASDSALRAEVDRMLACEDTIPDFLETPLPHSFVTAGPGDLVGRWTIQELIGEGGLGLVYRAITDQDGVTVEAALKILRPGWDQGLFQRRFVQERQILALIEHPGIARLMDCGADRSGRSFLAMEYVQGQLLGDFLVSRNPTVARRVEILTQLAEAIRYLHGRLIVHGDIKPGNVMITAEGSPKLLDFGTARWLQGSGAPGDLTRQLLTPRFASPEQKAGEPTSVLSDIYSFGKLFEEMLPAADSGRDLRAVVNRCLADDPAGRYPSVADLIEDLRRWREGLPVRARRLTLAYAASRFVHRNFAASALALALTGALSVGWWLSKRSEQSARVLAAGARLSAGIAESQKTRAESATRAAAAATTAAEEHARRFRAIAHQLLGDADEVATATDEQHAVLERSLRHAIAELEHSPNRDFDPELSAAWRRLAAELCQRGDFHEGLPAFDRALAYAQAWAQRDSGIAAQRNYTLLRFRGAELHRQRGDMPRAIREASAVLRSLDSLPVQLRREMESTASLQNARLMASQGRMQPAERTRLLTDAMRGGHQFGHTQVRNRALSVLLDASQTAGNREELKRLCGVALEWGISTPNTRRICDVAEGENAASRGSVLTTSQLSETLTRIEMAQRTLTLSPHNFRANLDLGRAYARLAEHNLATGKDAEFEIARRHAESALTELKHADAESPAVVMFATRVDRLHQKK